MNNSINVDGISFRVQDDGSLLLTTPTRVTVSKQEKPTLSNECAFQAALLEGMKTSKAFHPFK